MEIHKPKPVRSWRELLTEVGVIVLSVCIALAAEQAVEWWHWRSEVAHARESIAAEMMANNANFYSRRIAVAPCIDRQIGEAEAILAAIKAGRLPGTFTIFRPAFGAQSTTSEWESERASQVLTHFPRAELAMRSRYYAMAAEFGGWLNTESAAWQELSVLQDPPVGMTTSDLIRLKVNLGIAKRMEGFILLNARRQLALSKRLGMADAHPDPVTVKYFCTMNYDDFLRAIATRERL